MKLYEYKDRDESHRQLEAVLKDGTYPSAECREDPNAEFPYQVWTGPASSERDGQAPPEVKKEAPVPIIDPEMVARIIAEYMKQAGK